MQEAVSRRGARALDYKWQAAPIVALGLFLSVLDSTIVSVALPAMRDTFKTDFDTITWVVTAYFLAQAAVIPVTGYLSDRTGTKRIFTAAMGIFVLGSALCAIAPSKEALIAARVLQGIGGGALWPTAFAIAYRAFPRDEWGRATTIIGVPVLLAPVLGPVLGGYLTTDFSWRAIFAINLPLGALALVLAATVLRDHDEGEPGAGPTRRHAFDVPGFVLSMAGFTTLVYGLTEAGIRGWSDGGADRALVAGAVLLAALIVVEARSPSPVLDVRLFLNATFARANVVLWIVVAALYGSLFLIPFFFEQVEALSPVSAGEILISQGLAAAVAIALAGELYSTIGPRRLVTAGAIALGVSMIGFAHLTAHTSGASLQVWLVLRGLGLGFTTQPLQNLALSVVSHRDLTRASSLVNVARQVFTAAGVAGLAAYTTQRTATHVANLTASLHAGTPQHAAADCLAAGAGGLSACLQRQGIVMGLNDAFTLTIAVCGLAAIVALFVGRDPSLEALKTAALGKLAATFPHLSRQQLVEIAGRATPLSFEPGQVIVRQGDPADRFYVIASGEVGVRREGDDGRAIELETLGPGQYFGEIGLMANVPRTATVAATTPVEVLALAGSDFADLVGRSAETAASLQQIMAERWARLAGLP